MKKFKYIIGVVATAFVVSVFLFFLQPNQKYLKHAAYIAELDARYGIKPGAQHTTSLLKQRFTLLPHIRRQYTPLVYSVPKDLHLRTALLQQESNSLDQLRMDAQQTQNRLACFLNDICSHYEGSRLYIPEIKGMSTINHLLVSRWEGVASRITDYSRATISFPTLEMMYDGLERLKKSGLIILNIMDSFEHPCLGGYRDIKVVFRDFVNGHIGELQLNTNRIMDFKNGLGTALFHVIRELMAVPKLKNRPLTENEQICLDTLFEIEKEGYEAALFREAEKQKTIGIYSGSFDPPTKAHLDIILSTLSTNELDKLILYVNTMGDKDYQAQADQRKEMLELMLRDYTDRISVYLQTTSDKRSDYRKIRGIDNKLVLIMGEDSYEKRLSLHPIQIIECDKIFIIPRKADSKALQVKLGSEAKVILVANTHSISSTLVREKLKNEELSGIDLHKDVLNYILSNNLYGKSHDRIR